MGQDIDGAHPRVAGRFRVRRRLAVGPHGVVFEAEDEHLGIPAAVKLLPAAPGDAPALVESLGVLIDTLRELDAPGLTPAYDVGLVDKGSPEAAGAGVYLATELASLGSVGAFPRVPVGRVAAWALELLDAVEACHQVGLTHGHIAPPNALVEAEPDGSLHARLVDVALDPALSRRPPSLDAGIAQDMRDLTLLVLDLVGERRAVDWSTRRVAAPLALRADVTVPAPLRALFERAAAEPAWGDGRALRAALTPLAAAFEAGDGQAVAGETGAGEPPRHPTGEVAAGQVAATWAALSRATTRRGTLDALAAQAKALCDAEGIALFRRGPSGQAVPWEQRGRAAALDAPALYEAARAVLDGQPAQVVPLHAQGGAPAWAAVVPFRRGEILEALAVALGPASAGPVRPDGEPTAADADPDGAQGAPATEPLTAAPPPSPSRCLASLTVLGDLGAAVAERAAARQALLDETATRVAMMDVSHDALLLLGPEGLVRGLTRTTADLLNVHREAAVGQELGSLRGLGALGRVLRWARALDGEVVAVPGGQLLVRSQPVEAGMETGAVVRLEPMHAGSRPSSGSWQRRRGLEHVVGTAPALVAAVRQARRAATHSRPVVLVGEAGTGRKLLAEAIHRTSPRAEGPFLVFRAAAVPPATHAQALLGVAGREGGRGDASSRPGKLPLAHGGTLVIERPDCLAREVQEVLARVIAHGYGTPLGGGPKFSADVRIIAVTEIPLEEAARAGRCTEELVRLLRANRVIVPPLRERRGDVPALLGHALARAAREAGRAAIDVAPEVLHALSTYEWPGNVRELVQLADAWMTLLPPEATVIDRVPAHIERALSLAL